MQVLMASRLASQTTINPHTAARVEQHTSQDKNCQFARGDAVFVRNYHAGDRWLPGVIAKLTGSVYCVVKLTDGRHRHGHQDQVRKRTVDLGTSTSSLESPGSELTSVLSLENSDMLPTPVTESDESEVTQPDCVPITTEDTAPATYTVNPPLVTSYSECTPRQVRTYLVTVYCFVCVTVYTFML